MKVRFQERTNNTILNFDLAFLVELHLDDILDVLLVVELNFLRNMYINTKERFT